MGAFPTGPDKGGDGQEEPHGPLGDQGSQARAQNVHVQAEDQKDLKGGVEDGARHGGYQGDLYLLQPAEDPVGRVDQEHGREAEDQSVQIGLRCLQDWPLGSHQAADGPAQSQEHGADDQADDEGQPHAVHTGLHPLLAAAGAHEPGHLGGGPVGQEDAQAYGGQHHGGSDGEPGQGRVADVAHDGGVDHDEERGGDQLTEGGYGQPSDGPVGRPPLFRCD